MLDGPAMYVVIQSVLSLSLSRSTTSFVRDSGDCMLYTVPICDGPRCKVSGGILSFQLRGHSRGLLVKPVCCNRRTLWHGFNHRRCLPRR